MPCARRLRSCAIPLRSYEATNDAHVCRARGLEGTGPPLPAFSDKKSPAAMNEALYVSPVPALYASPLCQLPMPAPYASPLRQPCAKPLSSPVCPPSMPALYVSQSSTSALYVSPLCQPSMPAPYASPLCQQRLLPCQCTRIYAMHKDHLMSSAWLREQVYVALAGLTMRHNQLLNSP